MNKVNLPRAELSGRYKLEVRRHGVLIHDTGWFDNLITDAGLNALGESVNISAYVMVGTSNAAPAATDTALIAQIASKDTSTVPSKTSSQGVETAGGRYGWLRLTCPFAQGAVVGIVAEVGIGWNSTNVFSRSLVSPAAPIIDVDQLTVVYELRMYIPTADITGTVNIGGTSYNYTIRPIKAASTNYAGEESPGWATKLPILGASARKWVNTPFDPYTVWNGCLTYGAPAVLQTNVEETALRTADGGGSVSPSPSGGSTPNGTTPTNHAYSTGSLRCEFSFLWGIDRGNIDGGQAWLSRTSGTTNALNGVAFGSSLFVAVGAAGTILTSPSGITWTTQSSGTANALNAVSFGAGLFVAVGAAGTILTSPNGTAWTSQTSGTANALNGVAFGGGLFVAVGAAGTILTSPDGIAWTTQTSGTAAILYAVTQAAGVFVAVGAGGVLITSPGATAWTSRTSGTASDLRFVAFGVGLFIAGGPNNFTTRSFDGFSWTAGTFGVSATFFGITFTNIMAFAAGASGAMTRSAAGTTWSSVTVAGSITHNAITNGLKTLVAVGAGGAISTSSTGGIQGFVYSGIFGTYQCVLDGVIDKDNTKTLTIRWEQTWARRP